MSLLDWIVLTGYTAVVLAVGYVAKRGHEGARDLLLGSRAIPTWAVLGSMVATELSAATFLGVPDASWSGNWSYLELAFGALLGKLAVSMHLIPLYHRMRVVSIYQLLERRFGPGTQRSAAWLFVAGRILASGVRLYIAALALSVVTGTRLEVAILATGMLVALYTRAGGIRSVIWTDTIQASVFLAGALTLLVCAVNSSEGGLSGLVDWAQQQQRTQIFTWQPFFSLSDTRPFGTALIGGFFLTLATHGTDQDMVQRLLAARSGKAGARALRGSALLNFPITALFLAVGTAIAYQHAFPQANLHAQGSSPESLLEGGRVVSTFALQLLPSGLRGLVFAGLLAAAMSSLDSAICAIATTWVVDLGRADPTDRALSDLRAPEIPPEASQHVAARMRAASLVASGLLVAAALAMAAYHAALPQSESGFGLIELALSAMTILYGALLGVFAVAALGQRGSERGARIGLAAGAIVGLALFVHPVLLGASVLAWTWWIPCSAAVTAALTLWIPAGPTAVSKR